MDSTPEQNPRLSSPGGQEKPVTNEPTIKEIRKMGYEALLTWIKQAKPTLLSGEDLENFKKEHINGDVFLDHAGDWKFFKERCNQPAGPSDGLAKLASEVKGKFEGSTTRKRERPPHTHTPPPPKRTRVDDSSLIIQGKPREFQSGQADFRAMLVNNDQVYFDRTRFISVLEGPRKVILFCRPRRFGKSLTISMLEHFHGLQYANEHQTFYQDLDVQKDIEEKKCKPGQYFVLTFDFSSILPSTDLTNANENLIVALNSSFRKFYMTYATYLGEDFTSLCGNIESRLPSENLRNCNRLVRRAISRAQKEGNEELSDVQGIYLLVDEYDAFTNNYLETPNIAESYKTTWDNTVVGYTFKTFWSVVKLLCSREIKRVFITGISPLSLSGVSSAFNMAANLSFHPSLAGLCGLTSSDLEKVLKEIYKDDKPDKSDNPDKHLSEMTKSFNGYHFCRHQTVETVYNTETCLAYLQSIIDGGELETEDPPNSEVAEEFLKKFATSASTITDFEKALQCDKNGNFVPLEYRQWKQEFTLQDLRESGSESSWRSLMVYFGALTFYPEDPVNSLKIPNKVAASRIASVVLERYQLSQSLIVALKTLVGDGDIKQVLSCYRDLMTQRDVTFNGLTKMDEEKHRDSFYFSLLRNHYLLPYAEFQAKKPSNTNGRIDLLIPASRQLIVTEWKFFRITFLDVLGPNNKPPDVFTKADILHNYKLSEILELKFIVSDICHRGTIKEWVTKNASRQLRDYIRSHEVMERVVNEGLELRAHLVIIVGSRHILLWDMDKGGNLADEPHLVGMTSTWDREKKGIGS